MHYQYILSVFIFLYFILGVGSNNVNHNCNIGITYINPLPSGHGAQKAQFLDGNNGYVWDSTRLYSTSNGGRNWSLIYKESLPSTIDDVQFTSPRNGWIFLGRHLLKTRDSGKTWEPVKSPLLYPKGISTVFKIFSDNQRILVAGGLYMPVADPISQLPQLYVSGDGKSIEHEVVYLSIDGGETWDLLFLGDIGRVYDLVFSNSDIGLILGIEYDSVYSISTADWKVSRARFKQECMGTIDQSRMEAKLITAIFVNPEVALLSIGDGRVMRSNNSGRSWCDFLFPEEVYPYNEVNGYFHKLQFFNTDCGLGLKANGELYKTVNGGMSWAKVTSQVNINDMCFLKSGIGFLTSKNGLYKISVQ